MPMTRYCYDKDRSKRMDDYMDNISTKDYSYTHLANLAYLAEPELASRTDFKAMAKAIMHSLSYALYYGKRNVELPGLGKIETSLIQHRDETAWKRGRRQRWHWRLKTMYNERRVQDVKADVARHMHDIRRMYFFEPKNYRQEWWERYQKQVQEYWCVDAYTFLEVPDKERFYMELEMYKFYRAKKEEAFEVERQAALESDTATD